MIDMDKVKPFDWVAIDAETDEPLASVSAVNSTAAIPMLASMVNVPWFLGFKGPSSGALRRYRRATQEPFAPLIPEDPD